MEKRLRKHGIVESESYKFLKRVTRGMDEPAQRVVSRRERRAMERDERRRVEKELRRMAALARSSAETVDPQAVDARMEVT